MDLYNTISSWVGWPVVVALLILGGSYAYFVFQNRLDFLKDKNEWLDKQVDELKKFTPDVLAQRLSERLRILTEELERLSVDHKTNQEVIQKKETELNEVKGEIFDLQYQIQRAEDLLQLVSDFGLMCPQCGAPLISKETHYELVEYGGRELDIDHEIIVYDCGRKIIDGETTSECQRPAQ
jgi:DNA repair exonuclease SbcCD ATPase subunit